MSLGGSYSSTTERDGMDALYQSGVLLVAAAGNAGNTTLSYPASYDSVISVAAVDASSTVASFSQKNWQVELAAPGVSVLSTTSYGDAVSLTVGGTPYAASHVEYAARTSRTGALADGGLATSTNKSWRGKVVLVQRGTNTFANKVKNVQASGGVACIIYNNVEEGDFRASLGEGNSSTIPAVGITLADGQALLTRLGQSTTVSSTVVQPGNGYDTYNGTSMATPHVAGVAALIWSEYPEATALQVRQALQASTLDLGPAGHDHSYGFGLVQAHEALNRLGEYIRGEGEPPPPMPTPPDVVGDTTPPVLLTVTSTAPDKRGNFSISVTTDEPSRCRIRFTTGALSDSLNLSTTHKFNFSGTKGILYTYYVDAKDEFENKMTGGPYTHQN
jgi:serine protease